MMIGNSEEHRLILYFARRGATVWIAHLDNMRLFERAFNRAGWPIAWTEDAFNPRPILVFGLPVGVGIETRRDPVEVTLANRIDVEPMILRLNRLFPQGIEIVHWEEAPNTKKSLMSLVKAADYRIEAPMIGQSYSLTFGGGRRVVVPWTRKGRTREIDITSRIFETYNICNDSIEFMGGAGSDLHLRIDLLLDALVRDGKLAREDALGARIIRKRVHCDFLS
ncbi:MAG: TIGR03936 family radical SAM-associated protein [Saccharofermentanales bacterium]